MVECCGAWQPWREEAATEVTGGTGARRPEVPVAANPRPEVAGAVGEGAKCSSEGKGMGRDWEKR